LELEQLASNTRQESGLEVDIINLKGDVYELTDEKAEELGCGLIVVGLDTQLRFRSFLGGTNITKFIKKAPCPIITIRSTDNRNDCKNILMPIDLSIESREKVGTVVQLAKYYGASVKVISVFSPNDEKYENKLLPYLNQVKKFIKDKGINCSNKSIPSNNVADAIIKYANENECDLIVQMSKKDTSLGEMFGPPVSMKIVEMSNIPVLSVPPVKRESVRGGIH
jgi:nucleotide-binding universal stress UspA family protein